MPSSPPCRYLTSSAQYTGNNVMHQSIATFFHFLKPAMAVNRIPEVRRSPYDHGLLTRDLTASILRH